MPEHACLNAIVDGVVQGVGFRYFTERAARALGLSGWVRNLPDGRVEVEVEGEEGVLNAFLAEIRRGPPNAHVTNVRVERRPPTGQTRGFQVRF